MNIIKILKDHGHNPHTTRGGIFVKDVAYLQDGSTETKILNVTGWNVKQLRDWLGY